MHISRVDEIKRLKQIDIKLFEDHTLNIVNGQVMYDEFKKNNIMGSSFIVPFNEAMCVNPTAEQVFSDLFIKKRASGHEQSEKNYIKQVIEPLDPLINGNYQYIVLWFGEDMFCQMNLLTLLAYLEQTGYGGKIFLNSFKESVFKVNQMELHLGNYASLYKNVLIKHQKPSDIELPLLAQAIDIYLDLLNENNHVTDYISKHKDLPNEQLLDKLFKKFSNIGYGDIQYLDLINNIR